MKINNTTNWQGRTLGRYMMMRILGRGGMGEVWLAEDTQLRRQVAIKLLPGVLASEQNYLQDFAYEARTAAALEHPHILPVHDYGKQENANEVFTYLVMPYIRGGSLRERMQFNNGPLSQSESLHYLRQAAQAIDYAHSKGVLHRDIKPANMLLEQDWLLLADFGIAKLLTSATYRSRTHSGAGTPEYMAPEQAQGRADAASDRYSLAVVAYRLFTGRAPFQGETPYDILVKHIRETPPAPRQFNPALPQVVESMLLQGLAKRPEERPTSCTAFVDGLERVWQIQRLQQVDPEATLPAPWNKRFQENAAFSPTVLPHSQPLNQHLPPTVVDRMPLPQTEPAANFQSGNLPQTPYQSGNQPQAPYQAGRWNQLAPTQPAPTQPAAKGKVGRRGVLIGGTIVAAAAIVGGFALPAILHHSTPTPPTAKKAIPGPRNLIPGVPILSLTGHSDGVWNAIWDPTGRYLATAGLDTRVMLWDVGNLLQKNTGSFQSVATPLKTWKLTGEIEANQLCWSGDGRFLLATFIGGNNTNNVSLLNPLSNDTNPIVYSNANLDNNLYPDYGAIACPPHTTTFAAARSSLSEVKIDMWKPDKTSMPFKSFSYTLDSFGISVIAWSPDGKMLAASTNDSKVVTWEASTGAIKQVLALPDRTTDKSAFVLRNAMAWSPIDPNILLVSNLDVVNVWNVPQKKLLYTLGTDDPDALTAPKNSPFKWHPNVLGITMSPNGRYIVSGYGRSAKMYLWDLQNQSPTIKNGVRIQDAFIPASNGAGGHNGIVIDAEWSPNGRYIASASSDKTVIIWKVDQ